MKKEVTKATMIESSEQYEDLRDAEPTYLESIRKKRQLKKIVTTNLYADREPSHLDEVPDNQYNPTEDDRAGTEGFNLRLLYHPRSHYTPAQKIELVTTWLFTGNMKKAAQICKINPRTAAYWQNSVWWNDTVEKCKAKVDSQIEAGYRKILINGVDALNDKITNGEQVAVGSYETIEYTETVVQEKNDKGEMKDVTKFHPVKVKKNIYENKPILSKDLNRIVGTMQEKILLLQGKPTSISQQQMTQDDALKAIGKKLEGLSQGIKQARVVSEQ